jgi:radical SAM superfamily enzyme YgiQ (UPF0313 family)
MKVCLIAPPMPFSGRVPMPPPVLEYLAALTWREMPDAEVELIDAEVDEFDLDADLVGITAMTATVTWAYALADRLRARGVSVVLGGIHVTALPEEAASHADAVVVGEAESVWGSVLRDVVNASLRPRYLAERLPLDDLPHPAYGQLAGKYRFRSVFTARGCPYGCTFCTVRRFFGDTVRYRPIGQVVEEVAGFREKLYINGDDNIWGGDPARSIALFRALAEGERKHWYGFGDLRAVQGPRGDEMLAAAKKSGLFSVWAGWESASPECLREYHASAKQGADREDAIRRIQAHGIEVVLFMVLGGRADTAEDFERALEVADRLNVGIHPVLLTPLPGTELFEEYRPYLLPGMSWDRFTGTRAVFEHPSMTPEERERRYYEISLEALSSGRLLRHTASISPVGFPTTHVLSLAKAIPIRRAVRRSYDEWLAEQSRGREPTP